MGYSRGLGKYCENHANHRPITGEDNQAIQPTQTLAKFKEPRHRRNNPRESKTAAWTLRRNGRFLMGLGRLEPEARYGPETTEDGP